MAKLKTKLPSIKPHQLGLMMIPDQDRVVIVIRKPNDTLAIKDVTSDFALMLAAEILKEGDCVGIERDFEATDSFGQEMLIRVTAEIIHERNLGDPLLTNAPE